MADQAKQMWEARYGADDYLYGTEPNDFLRHTAAGIAAGGALCLADGEGRNSVHLAQHGHRVTAVDLTETGMAKARRLATRRGVEIETIVADLAQSNPSDERTEDYVTGRFG